MNTDKRRTWQMMMWLILGFSYGWIFRDAQQPRTIVTDNHRVSKPPPPSPSELGYQEGYSADPRS